MKRTAIKYWDNPKSVALLTHVLAHGIDETGFFIIPESTIHYPGGGGQPKDVSEMLLNRQQAEIIGTDFNDGYIKHYLKTPISDITNGQQLSIKIHNGLRITACAIHTVGHWITGIVTESLELPLIPVKGYHYFDGPYVEFSGDPRLVNDELADQINTVMAIDRQANLKVSSAVLPEEDSGGASEGSYRMPRRMVTIEGYAPLGCGGTHVEAIREIKSAVVSRIYTKNGKIRIAYQVKVWEEVAS